MHIHPSGRRKPMASDSASYAVDMTLPGPDDQPLDLTGTLTADAAPPEPEPPFACPMPGDES
jgi:hypothetical protein